MISTSIQPIEWRESALRILDQTLLPGAERYIETRDYREVCDAIRRLAVRGAPLIGIAGGFALALALQSGAAAAAAAEEIAGARATAINLGWAVDRVLRASAGDATRALGEARRAHAEQIAADLRMGELGADLLPERCTVLTHCNTGTLATGGIGRALGVVRTAHARGMRIDVLVDETRPLLQGARLTAWELARDGIAHRIIVDSAAAGLIARGAANAVLVGADRVAANGDTANKVGTYGLALAAHAHGVPFYVVAPVSTIDTAVASGEQTPIEERSSAEVLTFAGTPTAPPDAGALNPAFDVTPSSLITAIVTETAVLRPPYDEAIKRNALVGAQLAAPAARMTMSVGAAP
jgi:methylthioribose-1-phosphate isomerase